MEVTDELVEIVAKATAEAFWNAQYDRRTGTTRYQRANRQTWSNASERQRENWRADARQVLPVVLAAIEAYASQ